MIAPAADGCKRMLADLDPYGLALASRLAASDYLAYSKEARIDPVDRRSECRSVFLQHRDRWSRHHSES
jgi:hypothetical protein